MPTYEYLCDDHGVFTAFKPVAQYRDPEPCPECASAAPRVMFTAPQVRGAGKSDAGASTPSWLGGMKRHSGGCACC